MSTSKILFSISIIFIIGILLISGVAATSYHSTQDGGERKPVGPPVGKEPPQPPADPCTMIIFMDQGCHPEGKASGPFVQEAWGAAAIACDNDTSCITSQAFEAGINQAFCEGKSTDDYSCILEYTVPTSNNCSGTNFKDCTPKPEAVGDPLKTNFTCTVKGNYDITDYKCKTDPNGPHGEEE